jgi:hypothetical protein
MTRDTKNTLVLPARVWSSSANESTADIAYDEATAWWATQSLFTEHNWGWQGVSDGWTMARTKTRGYLHSR